MELYAAIARLQSISFAVQSEADLSAYSESEIEIAKQAYSFVVQQSDNFNCSLKWLAVLWEAAYADVWRRFAK